MQTSNFGKLTLNGIQVTDNNRTIAVINVDYFTYDGVSEQIKCSWAELRNFIGHTHIEACEAIVKSLKKDCNLLSDYKFEVIDCDDYYINGNDGYKGSLVHLWFEEKLSNDEIKDLATVINCDGVEFRGTMLPKPVENCLIVMVGLPRSGKSTIAKEELVPMVNPDSIRYSLHGNAYIPEAEPMVWTINKYMIDALFKAGHRMVIEDSTNTTRERRNGYVTPKYVRWLLNVPTNSEVCIERAMKDGNNGLADVIRKMTETYEAPHINELRPGDVLVF